MAELWHVLDYDEIAAGVARTLSEGPDIAVLQGPPGVGKSWLAKGVGAMWQEGGGRTIVAEGDLQNSDDLLYPFGLAMTGLSSSLKRLLPGLASMTRAGETLLGTAGLMTATVEALAKARLSRARRRRTLIDDTESDILHEIEQLAGKRPLLLIADNLHWWDKGSLRLLLRLRDPRMWAVFPFLEELRVVAVQTVEPYQHVVNPEAHRALLRPSSTVCFDIPRIPRESFEEVLAALGAGNEIPDEVVDTVYASSGGHLALSRQCANRIAKGEVKTLIEASESDDFLRRVLEERLDNLGEQGKAAMTVLQVAAVLGLTFRRQELLCASDREEAETVRLLRYCRDEAMLELDDEIGKFVHDLYRQHFLGAGSLDPTSIHESLVDCLRLLRPGDYELRSQNAARAERQSEAAALAVQAALARQREGLDWQDLPPATLGALDHGGMRAVAETFEAAHKHLKEFRFEDCQQALGDLPGDLPRRLRAEADYLQAACLLATRSEDDRVAGEAILAAWEGYEQDEPELGIRLMMQLLYGKVLMVDKAAGLELEARIRRTLNQRTDADATAIDALATLDRCAGSLHVAERALRMTRYAVEHYGPTEQQTVLRRPTEYYRCLTNLEAALIANARYAEALAVHERFEDLIEGYEIETFPRLDYPKMNALLAEYRQGSLGPAEALRRQEEILAEHGVPGDPFFSENPLGVYHALSGSFSAATEVFDRLLDEIRRRPNPEPAIVYMLEANRAATLFVSGRYEDACERWSHLAELVLEIPYVSRPYMVRRHELLEEVIQAGELLSPLEFDTYLLDRRPAELGPQWDQLGRGFWLPEIEWWN
ncbi:MAG: AAA family ATPase [Actinomycetota bacterium]|nr:AAA family ATPase [Actinomycetota bacterium]